VKTLAIRGTAEENMVIRRNFLKGNQGRIPKLIEEAGMRQFIEVRVLPLMYSFPRTYLVVIEPKVHRRTSETDFHGRYAAHSYPYCCPGSATSTDSFVHEKR
jgi:hypothetical protein